MNREDARVDQAMARADELLAKSLQKTDRRRWQSKLAVAGAAIILAGLFMSLGWVLRGTVTASTPPSADVATKPARVTTPDPASPKPASPTPKSPENLTAKLLGLGDDWRAGLACGYDLAAADPDAALAILNNNWPRIAAVPPRQQILKAFVFENHPRVLDVLHLGMNDPSPQVQTWATDYLKSYAFQDFSENRSKYESWRKQAEGKPLSAVVAESVRAWVESLKTLQRGEIQRTARDIRFSPGLDKSAARQAAIDAGALEIAAKWLKDYRDDSEIVRAATDLISKLKPDQAYLRRVALPLLTGKNSDELQIAAVSMLGRSDNAWAVEPLVEALRAAIARKEHASVSAIAGALNTIGDSRAIPPMIAVIVADNTYDTVYGVGYFGLSKLTGVKYDKTHDGPWWQEWWNREKKRFPEPARSLPIPQWGKASADKANPALEPERPGLAANDSEPPAKDVKGGANDLMRYFLIGPTGKKDPANGYHLLLVVPGDDGSAEFNPFITNIARQALPEGFLLAELVAPTWSDDENRVVWPTTKLGDPKAKFTTEEFIDAVVADVAAKNKINTRHVHALGWSSGGPPVYATAMRAKTPLTGALVAMSVFKPDLLPAPENAKGRAFYILHSPQDFIAMRFPEAARTALKAAGAQVELATYEGGHGWHGDVFGMIRTGIDYLDKQAAESPGSPPKPAK